MADRGIYRSVYSVTLDSREFLELSSPARHVLLTLKVSRINNMAGIFIFGAGEMATLVEQTGLEPDIVRMAIDDLVASKWLFVGDGLMWLRNHLKYDPHISLANQKHKKGIISIISALPRVDLVLSYCDYYELAYPFDSLSHTPSILYANHNKEKEKEKEKEKDTVECEPIPIEEIIADLNRLLNTNYKPSTKDFREKITARWREGYRLKDFLHVNAVKCNHWLGTEQERYLNPGTLYRASKFPIYVNQKFKPEKPHGGVQPQKGKYDGIG